MFFLKKKIKQLKIDDDNIPKHIGIIMDGNGRWAKKRSLPREAGHREGAATLKKVVRYAGELGVKYLTVYAFSTENWKRPESEVKALMDLLKYYLKNAEKELGAEDIRIRVIGDKKGLSSDIVEEIDRVEKNTKSNNKLQLIIALNYGGRSEIISAVKKIANDVANRKINLENIDDKYFGENLYTYDVPDPDLIIRTSGEQRISNFLLWQSAYSELYFTDTLWPDFSRMDLLRAIYSYQNRNRRYGGI